MGFQIVLIAKNKIKGNSEEKEKQKIKARKSVLRKIVVGTLALKS